MTSRRSRIGLRARVALGLLGLVLVGSFAALAIMLATDPGKPTSAPKGNGEATGSSALASAAAGLEPCAEAGFAADDFSGCLRQDFNTRQRGAGGSERIVSITCTEMTELMGKQLGDLPDGYRYFGCRIRFNQDGTARAVMAWHETATFAASVTIERIQWSVPTGLESGQ